VRVLGALFSVALAATHGVAEDAKGVPVQAVRAPCAQPVEQVQRAPMGPFAAIVFCNDALGTQLGVVYLQAMDAPWDNAWRLADRFWQDDTWGLDITSLAWSPSGRHLYVGNSCVYGTPALFDLDVGTRSARVVLRAKENEDVVIEAIDPAGRWLDVAVETETDNGIVSSARQRIAIEDTPTGSSRDAARKRKGRRRTKG
jgi:hypothetical protein